jgi:hypothetical protein
VGEGERERCVNFCGAAVGVVMVMNDVRRA